MTERTPGAVELPQDFPDIDQEAIAALVAIHADDVESRV